MISVLASYFSFCLFPILLWDREVGEGKGFLLNPLHAVERNPSH